MPASEESFYNKLNNPTLTNCTFRVNDFEAIKQKVLNWVKRFSTFCFLDNHQYQIYPHTVECLLAAGVRRKVSANAGNVLGELEKFIADKPAWLFGHLGYDLKNEIEKIPANHIDAIGFPDLFFFEPQILIRLSANEIVIEADDPKTIFRQIESEQPDNDAAPFSGNIQSRISREEYIAIINKLKRHIIRGDCYEINFCQEFFSIDAPIDPVAVYRKLSAISPNPFSALYREGDKWLICASPERFLKKEGSTILSQPIKGTSKRHSADKDKDAATREELFQSAKDRSENVMVVDLVRNDLSKICKEGSVRVDELFGIYSFPQVHQMISTVTGELPDGTSIAEIIRAVFPMGSMTGAPKKRVMELIEEYEKSKRGIFSGALGYISPDGDFDFNVVIRSILYNEKTRYLSFPAGSGITFYSDAEKEWDECLMKAAAIIQVLQ
jgi:para-aminobenzoate synthetase component I